MAPILEVKNLSKSYKDFRLKNISFTLQKGYIMGFIGPNGAGKSTTIKLILNLIKRDSGEINVFGMDNISQQIEVKNRIGFVLDEKYFYEELTIKEMKSVIAPFYKHWDESGFYKYLKDFNLPPSKKIKDLSKGMKMKFSLAIALSHQADLLIMDEPTAGLDPVARHELLEILSFIIQDENKGILLSSHITSDLDKIADFITFINNGEIVFTNTKDDLLENYGLVKGGKELLDADIKHQFIGIRENQFGFEGLVKDKMLAKRLFSDNVLIEKPTLEDIMIYYTRGQQHV